MYQEGLGMEQLGDSGDIVIDELICEIPAKDTQYRLTVNTFLGIDYFHVRKYYLGFEGDYLPTKEGACFPATIESTSSLFNALCKILTTSEVLEMVMGHTNDPALQEVIKEYQESQKNSS